MRLNAASKRFRGGRPWLDAYLRALQVDGPRALREPVRGCVDWAAAFGPRLVEEAL